MFVRYWYTLRYLRPVQFYGRFWLRYRQPRPDLRPAPHLCERKGAWLQSAGRLPSMIGPRSFVFLNEPGQLDEIGWEGSQREKLWRYNQHYFDDLNAIDAPVRRAWHRALIDDWVANNPPGHGIGWEPYPLSLRVVNWIKYSLSGESLSPNVLHSLAIQIRWLTRRLEIHLLGNHLFANAKALVMAGLFFEGSEADAWLKKGLDILASELNEQILPDGGHFERSTMYHALALEDVLDLVNTVNCFSCRLSAGQKMQVSEWKQRARAMHTWLKTMCHPDGEISQFNDAAFDIAPSVAELDHYARRLLSGLPSPAEKSLLHMQDSGYVRLVNGHAVALLDVAPVGPDYLPGHAHADTLAFELSVGKQRVLVNSGTSCYGTSTERSRQRGTTAHNTVVIDGKDSSDVWGGFRVARRAYPMDLCVRNGVDASAIEVACSHNGYCRLPGEPVHKRVWRMAGSFTVEDLITGPYKHAEARFHFHPDLRVEIQPGKKSGTALFSQGTAVTFHVEYGEAHLVPSTWHPRFGAVVPNTCLVVKLIAGTSKLRFSWVDEVPADRSLKNS